MTVPRSGPAQENPSQKAKYPVISLKRLRPKRASGDIIGQESQKIRGRGNEGAPRGSEGLKSTLEKTKKESIRKKGEV